MKKILITLLVIPCLFSCSTNSLTGSKQFLLVSDADMEQMSFAEYQKVVSTSKVLSPNNNKNAAMVQKVANKLVAAITDYYTKKGLGAELANYKWEVNLIDENTVNAWCMPGGKIVVYTGLLPVTQNETALAIVMGHEIAHAIAKHGAARMSQSLATQLGGLALSEAVKTKPQETQALYNTAFGVVSNVGVILPFSRKNELEADKFGLQFAALAGYNPREAIPFWQRMSQGGGQKPPEFLSTHPSDERRIADLQAMMDDVVKNYYKPVK